MVNVDIPSQTSLVNDEINSLKSSKDKTERIEYYSAQNEVLLLYVKQIFFILYYIVFALMAVTLFTKRRQFSLLFVGVMVVFFGIFPYIVDYGATYAYYRWLDIMHYLYAGNAAYLYQPGKDRVDRIKMPESASFATCTGNACCPPNTTYTNGKCIPNTCMGSKCCPSDTSFNSYNGACIPKVAPTDSKTGSVVFYDSSTGQTTWDLSGVCLNSSTIYDPARLQCV
jgi:hypothetical protein